MHIVMQLLNKLADGGRAVQMRIDYLQLFIVVRVRMLVRAWVIRVIHARSKIRVVKVLILVIKPKRMADLLARNEISPRRRIVGERVEICVVELDRALSNVIPASNPDLRDSQPAVIAIRGIANLDSSARRSAIPRISVPGDLG